MNKLLKIVIAVLLIFHGKQFYSQDNTRSIQERYASTITSDELKEHLYILASDAYKGRDTGSPELKKAAEYLANYYKGLGVPPIVNGISYFQEYDLKRELVASSSMILGKKQRFEFKKDYYSFGGFNSFDWKDIPVVFVGYGIESEKYNDYKNIDVKGALVLCIDGEPLDGSGRSIFTGNNSMSEWSDDFRLKRDIALKKGAKGIVLVDKSFDYVIERITYFLDQPRMSLDYPGEKVEEVLPYFFISPKMAQALLKKSKVKSIENFEKKVSAGDQVYRGKIKSKVSMSFVTETQKFKADNVLCYIEGSDPLLKNEVVVISAHYDHVGEMGGKIYNGADDDGSGTVSAMEIAEAFVEAKKSGNGSRRSILVLHVSGEEKGLLGSEWYSEFPIFPLKNTVCDLNIDMIGRVDDQHKNDPNYVYIIGSDKLSTDLHKISEETNKKHTKLALDYTYNDPNDPNRFYYRSDHYNFAKHNIPVIFYFSGVHEDYHQPGDDPEKIMYDKMATIAKLIFFTAWDVANRDEKLKVDVVNDFKN